MTKGHTYTIEELMLDDSFVSFCTEKNDSYSWEKIIKDNPDQKEIFMEAQRLIRTLHGGLEKKEINQQIEKVRQALNMQSVHHKESIDNDHSLPAIHEMKTGQRARVFSMKRLIAYGAAACLLLFVLFKMVDSDSISLSPATQQIAASKISSITGERKTIHLPDGSVVILNSNSSISYGGDFNKNNREIMLTGDAFFVLAKNAEKPFVVTSGNISTTALGTEFFVKNHRNKQGTSVSLLEGKVRVASFTKSSHNPTLTLLPGEMAKSEDGIHLNKETFDSTWMRTWVRGKIVFNKTPIRAAIQELEKWYGIDITINEGGLTNQTITGVYDQSTLQDILKVICFSLNRTFYVSGNTITIE